VFLNRRAAAESPEETTICYKISLVQLITNLNIILYLSTRHTVYISVLILFMIMTLLIINTYVSLMCELKKIGEVFTSKFVGTGPSSYKKIIYRAAVSQRLRNTALENKKQNHNEFSLFPQTYAMYMFKIKHILVSYLGTCNTSMGEKN